MPSPLQNNITNLQNLLAQINSLPEAGGSGIELPSLTNEGTTSDLLFGKQLIDSDGDVVTGTFSIDSELSAQDELIAQIQAAVDSLPEASSGELSLQSKTVTPSTSSQTVAADNGYDGLDVVTVNPIPSTYVKPTSTKAATTYTPTTSNQTIPAGTYCSGVQTIKGDSNLIPANIVSGKSIFGVAGTATVGSGTSGSAEFVTGVFNDAWESYPEFSLLLNDGETIQIESGQSKTFNVQKNTIFICYGDSTAAMATSGGITCLMDAITHPDYITSHGVRVFIATGDFGITTS